MCSHRRTEFGYSSSWWSPCCRSSWRNARHLPHGRSRAGDRHLNFYETRDNLGYRDEDGFLFVADRIKDMIISGGENIYPAEIEGLLFDHPLVAEVAVIGTADEKWGERVCAVIAVAGDVAPTLDELREFVGGRLARYKLPRQLEIVDSLPRNATGKVLKTELRARFDQPPEWS